MNALLSFRAVLKELVINSIKIFKPNKAIGLDKISTQLVKDSCYVTTPSLTTLLNLYIQRNMVPLIWKTASVVPLFKKGDITDLSECQSISILLTSSKVLEKAVHGQFYQYLLENNLLVRVQFGFRHKSYTTSACVQFTDHIFYGMDNGRVTGVALLHLSKAFDMVNHSILACKLSSIGVDGTVRDWFESFISCWKQVTCYNNIKSDLATVSIGVDQSSILGLLLFNIFMNNLPNELECGKMTLYVGDPVIYFTAKINIWNQIKVKFWPESDMEMDEP